MTLLCARAEARQLALCTPASLPSLHRSFSTYSFPSSRKPGHKTTDSDAPCERRHLALTPSCEAVDVRQVDSTIRPSVLTFPNKGHHKTIVEL